MNTALVKRCGGVVTELCGEQVEIAFYIDGEISKQVFNFDQFSEVPKEGDRIEAMIVMTNVGPNERTPEESAIVDAELEETFNAIDWQKLRDLATKGPARI